MRQWRRNPFTGAVFPFALNELHTVSYFDDWNGYGIQLQEGVFLENPSTVIIVQNVTGGIVFTEVPRTTTPGPTNFRVDYDAENYTGTSRIEFHPSALGLVVSVDYRGTGLLAATDNYLNYLAGGTVPGSFSVEDDFSIGGQLLSGGGTLPIEIGNNLDLNSNRILNLISPVLGSEPVTKSYADPKFGAGGLGNVSGTVAGVVGSTAVRTINLPSTGDWLVIFNAQLIAGTSTAYIQDTNSSGEILLRITSTGNLLVASAHIYKTSTNAILLNIVGVGLADSISTVSYTAIRIS